MTTFVAILLALEGVNVQLRGGAEIVEGIGGLINGLAGKFLSSIIALLLAVTFTLFEKATERRLRSAYDDLIRTAAESIPVLSAFRVQLDVMNWRLVARRCSNASIPRWQSEWLARRARRFFPPSPEYWRMNLWTLLKPGLPAR